MIEKVFILHHTHVDFGYTDDRGKVCDELVEMVDQVTDLVAGSLDRPDPERFRWIHEISWPLLEYLRRGAPQREEHLEQIRAGLVELTALYVNPTDLFDRDTFAASLDYACDLARTHELPLTTAMFSDCPGIAWSVPDLLAERGVRYLSAAPDFIMSMPLEVERPFWWEGPDGGRVLTWFTNWRNCWYAEGLYALKLHEEPAEATTRMTEYLRRLEGEGYRWSALAIHHAMDNVAPSPRLMDFVEHFNAARSDVQATMATNRDFFEYMESRHGGEFTVRRGAWCDWWANGNGSAAFEAACSRRAKASLRRRAALAERLGANRDPVRLRQTMENLLLFDEHTWGYRDSVSDPWSAKSRLGWAEKRAYALRALAQARELEREAAERIDADGQVAVANPFDEPWTGLIRLAASGGGRRAPRLKNADTGELIVGQRHRPASRGDIRTPRCEDSYLLSLSPGQIVSFDRGARASTPPPFDGLESEHFRIEYDPATGAILQVHEKSVQRPLCDPAAPWGFAELVHERVRRGGRKAIYDVSLGTTNPESKRPRPEFLRRGGHVGKRKCRLVAGPIFNALVTGGALPGVKFAREVRVYHALPRIDVLLRLDKQVNTDYESLYLAFPFAVEEPEVWIENAGAVFRAGIDQLPGSATDWHSVGEYVAVSGGDRTVLLVPHDAPLVQVGDIHTGKWARALTVSSGHVYSWVMNNMWFTNFPACQEGAVELAWSVTVRPGPFDPVDTERWARSARVGVVVADRQRR